MKGHKLYSELTNLIADEKTDEFIEAIKSVERGVDIPCETYDMILDAAAYSNNEPACKFLINQGADPEQAFNNAFDKDDIDTVYTLINSGAEWDNGVFRYAACNGHIDLMERMLSKGHDINDQNNNALKNSTYYKQHEMSEFLLENGADAKDSEILRNAVAGDDVKTVEACIKHGADLDASSSYAIVKACEKDYTAIVKQLAEAGADLNANDDEPLKIAIKNNSTATTNYLLAEKKIVVKELTRDWMERNGYHEPLNLLKKRDLLEKITAASQSSRPNTTKKIKQSHTMKI